MARRLVSAAILLGGLTMVAGASSAPSRPLVLGDVDDVAGELAFVSTRDGTSEIYVMNADGSGQTRLTVNPAEDLSPAWSPDGSRIAFTSNRDGDWEVYVMDEQGGDVVRLTDSPGFDGTPSWSPDGTQIAFTSARDGNRELYVMKADGEEPVRVTDSSGADEVPAWAPDDEACGERAGTIAFESDRDGDYDIYVVREDGSALENLTSSAAHEFNPSWAPDCSAILFDRAVGGNYDVFLLDLATRAELRVTTERREDARATWSPDGSAIAFTSLRDGHYEIYVVDPDGQGATDISNSFPAADLEPSWRPLPAAATLARAFRAPRRGAAAQAVRATPVQVTCTLGPRRGLRLVGTRSNDVICSQGAAQTIEGRRGHDIIIDEGGRDRVYGGAGRDSIYARDGVRDVITGGPGVDRIYADRFDVTRRATGDAIAP